MFLRPRTVFATAVLLGLVLAPDAHTEGAPPAPMLVQLYGHPAAVVGLAVSPDARTLAAVNLGTVRLWDLEERAERLSIQWGGNGLPSSTPIALSRDGKLLANGPEIYDLAAGQVRVRLNPASEPEAEKFRAVGSVAFSPDGKTLATAGGVLYHYQAKLWDAGTGKWKRTLLPWAPGTSFVNSVAFSPDGLRVAADADGEVRIWEVETGKPLHRLKGPGGITLDQVVFSPDGSTVAAVGYRVDERRAPSELVLRFWDTRTGAERRDVSLGPYAERRGRFSLAYAPDGRVLAVSDGRVRLFDPESGKETGALPERVVGTRIAFFPAGKERRLAVGQPDGLVSVWSLP